MNTRKPSPPRPLRAKYVRQACVECRKRKTKCDGAHPCRKCEMQSISCLYPLRRQPGLRSKRGKKGDEKRPQPAEAQVKAVSTSPMETIGLMKCDDIGNNISTLDNFPETTNNSGMFLTKRGSTDSPPKACDGSNIDMIMSIIRTNLQIMDTPTAMFNKLGSKWSHLPGPLYDPAQCGLVFRTLNTDPLLEIGKEVAAQLIEQWCDGVGLLYPIIDRQKMLATADSILTTLQYAQDSRVQLHSGVLMETLFNEETNKLKLILAISRTLENGPNDEKAQELFRSITEVVDSPALISTSINRIQILLLAALYYYHIDEEVLSGRIVGSTARLCLEIGLHRRSTLETAFSNPDERLVALQTFWSVYMLERRTSLGQLIPFIIQDGYVDPSLFAVLGHAPGTITPPQPSLFRSDLDSVFPVFLELAKLCGKTWHALVNHGETGTELSVQSLGYLDYQIIQWYQRIPGNLKLSNVLLRQCGEQDLQIYIRAVLFFQKCQLRNSIYGQILQSTVLTDQYDSYAKTAIQIAKETLQMLADLNEKTPLFRSHPMFFKYPLLTALNNLLSAIVNGGSAVWETSRDEIGIALSLFELLSTKSNQVMRLWQHLEGLQSLQVALYDSLSDYGSASGMTPTEDITSELFPFEPLFHIYSVV